MVEAELARQRGLVADVERVTQHAASELIASRNEVGGAPATVYGQRAFDASQKRVSLVLEALDLVKRAALVQP